MGDKGTQTGKLLAAGVIMAWTVFAWWAVIFTAGWAGSLAEVLLNPHNDHLSATIVMWVFVLSPVAGWWLLLTGRLRRF